MKRFISCILTAAMLVGMLAVGSVAVDTKDAALKFDDTRIKNGGGNKGYASYSIDSEEYPDAPNIFDGNGFTLEMNFTLGHEANCVHPVDPDLFHTSKFAITLGSSEGTHKYFGYSATRGTFFFATSGNSPFSGESTDGLEYLAESEAGLVLPGVEYKVTYEVVGTEAYEADEAYVNIYLDGTKILNFDLYRDMDYPTYMPYDYLLFFPTHINCYIDDLAVYDNGVYDPATGEGADKYLTFTDFSDAEVKYVTDTDDDGNEVTNREVDVPNMSVWADCYDIVNKADEYYCQPQYAPAEGQMNIVFENDVDSVTGRDFTAKLSAVNNVGISKLELELMNDSDITVVSVEAADGLTAVLGDADANGVRKLTLSGSNYTGEDLAVITYHMSEDAVQGFIYGYGAKTNSPKLSELGIVITGGLTEVYNYTVGDPNGDGKFNIADVITILKLTAKWDLPLVFTEACDVNGDGRSNNMDVTYYLRWLAKWKGYMINGIAY